MKVRHTTCFTSDHFFKSLTIPNDNLSLAPKYIACLYYFSIFGIKNEKVCFPSFSSSISSFFSKATYLFYKLSLYHKTLGYHNSPISKLFHLQIIKNLNHMKLRHTACFTSNHFFKSLILPMKKYTILAFPSSYSVFFSNLLTCFTSYHHHSPISKRFDPQLSKITWPSTGISCIFLYTYKL